MSTTALVLPTCTARPVPTARPARPARPARCRAERVARVRRPLRLTRRGRLMITCTAATVLTSAVVAVSGALTGASAGVERTPSPSVHVVQPGQTLSVIASQWSPSADWREVAVEIVDLNALPSMQVTAGQRLTMPDRG